MSPSLSTTLRSRMSRTVCFETLSLLTGCLQARCLQTLNLLAPYKQTQYLPNQGAGTWGGQFRKMLDGVELKPRWLGAWFLAFTVAIVFSEGVGNRCLAADEPFMAGASAVDIAPKTMPVWVNGGLVANKADTVKDPLRARALVLKSGEKKIAIVVVDSCAILVDLIDEAKRLIRERVGIPPESISISATHAHSVPSVAGLHGTPAQEDYAAQLPIWIADAVEDANKKLVVAEVGWTSTECHEFIFNRHWRMQPGKATNMLFSGRTENIVQMNPGHDNPNKIEPVGPVDPLIAILSIRSAEGKPMAVLASFSTHYAGAPAISSDYFGVVCQRLAEKLRPDDPASFTGLMANGTSGDANCIDFSKPRKPFTHYEVGAHVSEKILAALPNVKYQKHCSLDSEMLRIPMPVRMPSEAEVKEAKEYIAQRFPDRLPKNGEENYARETVLLSEMPPERQFVMQVLRVGDLAIAANPCETYAETGLKLRKACKLPLLMNVGLANGYSGYIPPPRHFELGGYTTWRARSSCLVPDAEERMVAGFQQLLETIASRRAAEAQKEQNAPPQGKPNPAKPQDVEATLKASSVIQGDKVRSVALSPEESMKQFVLSPDLSIRLVASEPCAIDPVDAVLDDAGRLWVVEMRDYPFRESVDSPLRGAIKILTDKDLDGVFETQAVFADQLDMPTGIALWKDGVVATLAGELAWLRDTDGDGKCDQKQVWIEGFSEQNEQLRANHPRLELDGSWSIASGLRGGKVRVGSDLRGSTNADVLELGSRDVRLDPRSARLEAITGPAQFGLTSDGLGTRMFCSNRNPCVQVVFEQRLLAGNPLAGIVPASKDVLPFGEGSKVYPLVNAWTTSNLHAGQFTAACGVLFRPLMNPSKEFPNASTEARGMVYVCEPTGSLVQAKIVEHPGAVWQPSPPANEADAKTEWLASRDEWFRPVNLVAMPGNGVLVIDMHRAVIEHPAWVPDELKRRPDQRYGEGEGRIYWVFEKEGPGLPVELLRELAVRPLSKRSNSQLASMLADSDPWIRQTVSRILIERNAVEVAAELRKVVEDRAGVTPGARATAIQLVSNFAPEDVDILKKALADPHRIVRVAALRRIGAWATNLEGGVSSQEKFLKDGETSVLSKDDALHVELARSTIDLALTTDDPWIRFEAILCASQFVEKLPDSDLENAIDKLARIAAGNPDDLHLLVATAGLGKMQVDRLLISWMDELTRKETSNASLQRLVVSGNEKVLVGAARTLVAQIAKDKPGSLGDLLALIRYNLSSSEPVSELSRTISLVSLAELLRSPSEVRKSLEIERPLWRKVREIVKMESTALSVRTVAVDLLSFSPREGDQKLIRLLARESENGGLRSAAIRAWAKQSTEEFEAFLLEEFAGAGPGLRPVLLEMTLAKPARIERMAKALDENQLSAKQVGAVDLKRVVDRSAGDTKDRLQKHLDSILNSNRAAVVASYQASLKLTGDRERGKQIFAKQCAACHRIDGTGNNVGPDISDSRVHTLDKLLVSILDPNRAIDNNYFRYVVLTKSGRTVEGIIAEESGDRIVLRGQNDERHVIARDEVEQLKATGVSMMPEGLEAQMDHQSMADLISYIKNWRY